MTIESLLDTCARNFCFFFCFCSMHAKASESIFRIEPCLTTILAHSIFMTEHNCSLQGHPCFPSKYSQRASSIFIKQGIISLVLLCSYNTINIVRMDNVQSAKLCLSTASSSSLRALTLALLECHIGLPGPLLSKVSRTSSTNLCNCYCTTCASFVPCTKSYPLLALTATTAPPNA